MNFWDASALVPLCLSEAQSRAMRLLHEADPELRVWWGSWLECIAAVSRAVREGNLNDPAEAEVRACMRGLFERAVEIAPSEDVRARAERLLALHPLRAADALQLAAALVWARERTAGLGFVSLDRRLREAARKEGFTILPATDPR